MKNKVTKKKQKKNVREITEQQLKEELFPSVEPSYGNSLNEAWDELVKKDKNRLLGCGG
ncbi:MAG: hypothetical protein K1X55_08955 [Chitinophagales bacterium]|nr:hypothetical protein [Chitinophagales bacterium]